MKSISMMIAGALVAGCSCGKMETGYLRVQPTEGDATAAIQGEIKFTRV